MVRIIKNLTLALLIIPSLALANPGMLMIAGGGGGTGGTGDTGDTCSTSANSLLFSWHGESTDVTIGTPAGCSVGDEVANDLSGSPAISSTWKSDGTNSVALLSHLSKYRFDVNGEDIIVSEEGTLVFDIYITEWDLGEPVFYYGGGDDRLYINMQGSSSSDIDLRLNWEGNNDGLKTLICELGGGLNTKYTIIAKWSESGVGGDYMYIKCGSTTAATYTTAIAAQTIQKTNLDFMTNLNQKHYLDNIKIYNYWTPGDTDPR